MSDLCARHCAAAGRSAPAMRMRGHAPACSSHQSAPSPLPLLHTLHDHLTLHRSNPPLDPASACITSLGMEGVSGVCLSADQLVLACVSGPEVSFFSLPSLAAHPEQPESLAGMEFDAPVARFAWCPGSDEEDVQCYLAVLEGGDLLHGSLAGGNAVLQGAVQAASWAPDGCLFAYSSGASVVVSAPDWEAPGVVANVDLPDGEAAGRRGRVCG